MANIKTHKQGADYCKFADNVSDAISQGEKDELDSLTVTHQGSCVDLDSITSVAINDQDGSRKFFINFVNTSAENKIFNVDL